MQHFVVQTKHAKDHMAAPWHNGCMVRNHKVLGSRDYSHAGCSTNASHAPCMCLLHRTLFELTTLSIAERSSGFNPAPGAPAGGW